MRASWVLTGVQGQGLQMRALQGACNGPVNMVEDEAPEEVRVDIVGAHALPVPEWNPTNGQVMDARGAILGSIKSLHVSTPKESVPVYCRIHRCKPPLIQVHMSKPIPTLVRWLHAGQQETPHGAAGRHEHMHMWAAMYSK